MPRTCAICKKGNLSGHRVSHSNVKSPKISRPNLQRVHIVIDGTVRHTQVCTRCLRSGAVQKA